MTAETPAWSADLWAVGVSGRLGYTDTGVGPGDPVVFVHGANMSAAVWEPIISDLRSAFRCIALDLRGHGVSGRVGPFTLADYLDDLNTVLGEAGVERAHLVGVSLGGMLACVLAQEAPEKVSSVVTFGSALRGVHPGLDRGMQQLRILGVRGYFSQMLPTNSLPDGVTRDVRDALIAMAVDHRDDTTMVEAVTRAAFETDMSLTIEPSGRPVLVVNGEYDNTCTPEAGRAFAAAVGGEWRQVDGAGHILPLERPAACAALIAGFVRAHDQPAAAPGA